MGNQEFRTLNELFLNAAEKHAKPDAFLSKVSGQYRGLSSRQALEKVSALAASLDRQGLRRGDRVAILSENRVEWALTDYAVMGLGAVVVPIYPTLLEPDIEYILRDAACKGIVCSNEAQVKKVANVRARLPELGFVMAMDGAAVEQSGVENWQYVIDAALRVTPRPQEFFRSRAPETQPEETASILYTSGTMGQPKGVVLSHANLVSNILASLGLFIFDSNAVGMSFLPLCHVFERMLDYHYFWSGVSIAYAENFESLPQNLLEVRPTVMAVVPRVLEKVQSRVMEAVRQSPASRQKLFYWAFNVGKRYFPYALERRAAPLALRMEHAVADKIICSKVRARLGGRIKELISGAAPLSRELAEFFFAMGLPVYEGYGLTETSPVISVNYPGCVKLGTVGRVIPGVEVKLDDESTTPDASGGKEILVRGPNVTSGYYHLPEENQRAFAGGWFRTGDLGKLDPDGFLTIAGRKKNIFKTSGGKYVSPERLENLFQGHPYVSQIMILGEARRFVSALIVPNFARIQTYARERGIAFETYEALLRNPEILALMQKQVDDLTAQLPPHEKIRQIALIPREFSTQDGELSATQKIKRRVVEEHFRAIIEDLYSRHAPQPQAV